MKQKLYYFLLTTFWGLFGMNVWAQDLTITVIEGTEYYEIGNGEDLVTFAQIVNNGEYDANAVLKADIDMTDEDISVFPIGTGGENDGKRYTGTFDGQGHKITNFKLINTSAANNFGMFNTNTGVVLKNFWLDSSCEIQGRQLVSLIGRHDGGGTFEGIGNCANVTGTNNNVGGLFGGVFGKSGDKKNVYITNCWTANKVTSTDTSASNYKDCGALAGWFNNANVTITNFWTVAEVANYKSESTYIIRSGSGATFTATGCYSKYGAEGQEKVSFTAITDEQVSSGELCFKLNGDQSTISWYQTLPDDEIPLPYANGHDQVYMNGQQHCDGTAYEGTFYSNENLGMVADDHTFADGFCSYCGTFDETYMTANDEGIFEIGTANQLKWFAAYVNAGNTAANAVLTGEIDLTGVEWTPIGKGVSYGGTFDGQDFTISNFNYIGSGDHNGLFGKVVDATVKNFKINGTLVCAGAGSGVVGWSEGSTISNIHSALIVETPASGAVTHAGGVVGDARYGGTRGGSAVEYCSFTGTLTVNADSHDCFAGIAGYANDYCWFNGCANYGTLLFAKSSCYIGGIIGYINNNSCYGAHNCLNVGAVTYTGEGNPDYSGAIVGRLRNNNPAIWGENYWKQGSAAQANGENQLSTNYEVTTEQLASGEVAAKLAPYFRQNIGTDETPVLDPAHNVVAEITAAGYATLYVPNTDVAVPEGVEAFAGVVLKEGWLHLNAIEGGKIAAGEPVILQGAAGYYSFAPTTGATKAAENVLKGTDEDADGTGKYILAMPEGEEIGFYKAVSGTIIKAGKAYLESTSGVKAFYFDVDDATGIENIEHSTLKIENSIYDLSGRKINVQLPKGIYIVNGKKVLK